MKFWQKKLSARRCCVGVASLALCAPAAWAFSPKLLRFEPDGAMRGSDVELKCHGERLQNTLELLSDLPGLEWRGVVKAEAQQVVLNVHVCADAPLGPRGLRLRGSDGISDMRLFSIGQFPCVAEIEPNQSAEQAQPVELNQTISGVIINEDVDWFRVHLQAGQVLHAEIEALRLGQTLFDAALAIVDARGFVLAAADDSALLKTDCDVAITAPGEGDYWIKVRESAYEGNENCRYRLHVTSAPRPTIVFPLAAAAGLATTVDFLGDISGPLTMPITVPADGAETFPVWAQRDGLFAPSANLMRRSPLPSIREQEENNSPAQANALPALPCAADGLIASPGDVDWYRFHAEANVEYQIQIWARRLRSRLDPTLSVHQSDGASLASNDDQDGPDSLLNWKAPAAGDFLIQIRDQLRRGAADAAYRLEIQPRPQLLRAAIPAPDPNAPQANKTLSVPQGNRNATLVQITRDNVGCPVLVNAESLPAGTRMLWSRVAKSMTTFPLVLEADESAPVAGGLHRIHIQAEGENAANIRAGWVEDAIDHVQIQNQGVLLSTRSDRLALAVTQKVPWQVNLAPPPAPLVQQGVQNVLVSALRPQPDDRAISLTLLSAPPGVTAPASIEIAKDQTQVNIELQANGDAEPGRWPLVFLAEIQTPDGKLNLATQVAELTVRESLVQVSNELCAAFPGQTTAMTCRVEVKEPFTGAASVEIVGLPRGASSVPQNFEASQSSLQIPIQLAADAVLGKHQGLVAKVRVPFQGAQLEHRFNLAAPLRIDAPAPAPTAAQPAPPTASPAPAAPAPSNQPRSRLELLREQGR